MTGDVLADEGITGWAKSEVLMTTINDYSRQDLQENSNAPSSPNRSTPPACSNCVAKLAGPGIHLPFILSTTTCVIVAVVTHSKTSSHT